MSDFIICYDICDRKRLARTYRALLHRAVALQYSVFLFSGTEHQLQKCLDDLEELIDPRHDDLRAYPLPQRGARIRIGKPVLPAGIQYSALPVAGIDRLN